MKGILTGCGFGLAANQTGYVGTTAGLGEVWGATETRIQQVMPVAGTFDCLRIKSTDPAGSGQSRTFTLRVNAADSALTAAVNSGSTTASDVTHTVTVAAGDLVTLKQVASVTAASATVTGWVMRFTAANPNEFPLLWSATTGTGAGTTKYSPVCGDAALTATEANAQSVVPTGGAISNLYVALDANQATSGQTVTLFKNGSSTALTCTVGAGASTGNDTTHSVSVAAGDTVSLEWNNAGSTAPRARAGLKFAPTTDGESISLLPSTAAQAAFVTNYQCPGGGSTLSVTESTRQSPLIACSVRNLYTQSIGLAGGQSMITMFRLNAADSTLTNTIAGTASTGNDTTHSPTAVDDDLFDYRLNNTAGSGTFRTQTSAVFYIAPAASFVNRLNALGGCVGSGVLGG